MANTNTKFKKGMTPWNKGKKGVQTAWNKGVKGIHLSPSTEFKGEVVPHKEGCNCFRCTKIPPNKGKKLTYEAWNKGKTASPKAKAKMQKAALKRFKNKENHPRWKGGIDYENSQARHSEKYKVWRNGVYKRDNYICKDCGIKCSAKNIVAHHIKLFSLFPELRFILDNGITLCRTCHARLHKNIQYNSADGSAGITVTDTIVTDTRMNAGQLQKKTKTTIFKDGIRTATGAESDWTDTTDI